MGWQLFVVEAFDEYGDLTASGEASGHLNARTAARTFLDEGAVLVVLYLASGREFERVRRSARTDGFEYVGLQGRFRILVGG